MKITLEQLLRIRSVLGTYTSATEGKRVELIEKDDKFYADVFVSYKPKVTHELEPNRVASYVGKLTAQALKLTYPKFDMSGIDLTEPFIPEPEVFVPEPEPVNGLIAWLRL